MGMPIFHVNISGFVPNAECPPASLKKKNQNGIRCFLTNGLLAAIIPRSMWKKWTLFVANGITKRITD
jgi:hypothetical protein